MKVLLANDEKGLRGGEFQTIALAGAMAREGWEVIVAARAASELAGCVGAPVRRETFAFERIPLATPFGLSRLIGRWRPDILHAQTSGAHTHLWLARRLLREAPPLVVSRRVAFPVRRDPFSMLKYGTGVARYVPISSAAAASLSRMGISESRMTVVPSGVDVDRFGNANRSEEIATRWGVFPGDLVVGAVGALEREKGHAVLLEAAAAVVREHPRARFVIVGTGSLAGALARDISRLGLGGKARCVPQDVPLERILPLFDIFVLPSLSEGLSTALIAAMAAGLPVVASDTGGIPEVVTPSCAVLVSPGSSGDLSRAITTLLRNEALRRSMGEEGRQRAALFDIGVTVRRTLELYDRVISERKLAPGA